jgi:tetratricopeptide (TPR) repeat protein
VAEERPADAGAVPAGGAPAGPERLVFKSDDKIQKKKARYMLRMVDSLNHVWLAALPERHDPPVVVQCVTCHHGSSVPQTLQSALLATFDKSGIDSVVAQYKRMREDMASGRFDVSETSVGELARALAERGRTADAIRVYRMDQEYYPGSADIDFALGELYAKQGDRGLAIERFRAGLAKRPNDQRARRRLQELEGNGS